MPSALRKTLQVTFACAYATRRSCSSFQTSPILKHGCGISIRLYSQQTSRETCTIEAKEGLTLQRSLSTSSSSANDDDDSGDANVVVPLNFGGPNGPTIYNKDTILQDIDQALGVSRPPDLEILLTDHLAYVGNPISKFLHTHFMRFGHVAIRYTTSDGQQHVMNILGDLAADKSNSNMVNFVKPCDYFYGTSDFDSSCQQGGVYNRPFVGLRVEKTSPGATDALHAYFVALQKASEIGTDTTWGDRPGSPNRGAVRFQLVEVQLSQSARMVPAPVDQVLLRAAEFFRNQHVRVTPKEQQATPPQKDDDDNTNNLLIMSQETRQEVTAGMQDVRQALYNSGNCAQWTSAGLAFCGMIRRPRLFPKAILVDILEEEVLKYHRHSNVHVVYYREVEHAVKADPNYRFIQSAMVSPLKPIRNSFYKDLEQFASVTVTVPVGSTRAVIEKTRSDKERVWPGMWLQLVNFGTTYVPAAILIGLVDHVGPIGPATAGAWLLVNWWLY